jgi:2-oxoglutarate ferredoxin oxidoreductase subunit gamma
MISIKFAGSGGQGAILAGMILGKACAIYEDKEVVFTESYGAETRGGFSSSSVILSDKKIDYPYIINADILVAMSQKGYNAFKNILKKDGLLIYERDLVKINSESNAMGISATKISKESLGKTIYINIIILGYLTKITKIVSEQAIINAIKDSVPEKTFEFNKNAFYLGFNAST